jgi:hypothetical protein
MHLLTVVCVVFPWGLKLVGCEVFLSVFHPMCSPWDYWLANITNYLEQIRKLTVGVADCPQKHQAALASALQIAVAGSLLELRGTLYGLRQFGFWVRQLEWNHLTVWWGSADLRAEIRVKL